MAITFGGIAKVASQTAMNQGMAQAQSMGLGEKEGKLLGVAQGLGGNGAPGSDLVSASLNKLGSGGKGGGGLLEMNRDVLSAVFSTKA